MAETSLPKPAIDKTGGKSRVAIASGAWITLGAAILTMAFIALVNLSSPRTLFSFHGFIHAAIAEKFLPGARLAFPPENPFYAGQPLDYYWFFQFLGAQIAGLFGWNAFYGLKALVILSAGALVVAGAGFGRRLYRSTLAGLTIAFLILAGTNPFGFIIAGLKVATNGTRVLRDDPNFLWGVVHPIYSLIRFNDMGALYGPLLNFFLNLTSRPVALASLLGVLFCLYWLVTGGGWRAALALVLLSGLTTALSPIIGIAAGGALMAGMAGVWLWERMTRRKAGGTPNQEWMRYALGGGAILIGILAAWPTYSHLILGPSDSQVSLILFSKDGLRQIGTVALSGLPLYLLALYGLRRGPQTFLGILVLAASILLVPSAAIQMDAGNSSNFFHAAVVLMAVPASAFVLLPQKGEMRASLARAGVLVLVFLPTTLLLVSAYIRRPPLPVEAKGSELQRLPVGSDLAELYAWVQKDTDPAAIFVLDPRQRVTMVGNAAEFPAMTRRSIFTESLDHYLAGPYPDAKLRVKLAVKLVSGEQILESEQAYLSDFHRPLYIVCYQSCDVERLQSVYGPPVFRQDSVWVYRW